MNSPPTGRLSRHRVSSFAVAVALCPSLILSGCKNPDGTTWLGAGLGAAAGAVAGGLIDDSGEGAAVGAAVGALVGAGVGYVIYKRQMHLEAQAAASKARVDQAEKVLEKYRRYNQQLAGFTTNASNAARDLNSASSTNRSPSELAKAREGLVTMIDDAEKGGQQSVESLKTYRAKVESSTETSTSTDEERRKKQLQRIEELKQEEARLLEQLDMLTKVRGQVGGGG